MEDIFTAFKYSSNSDLGKEPASKRSNMPRTLFPFSLQTPDSTDAVSSASWIRIFLFFGVEVNAETTGSVSTSPLFPVVFEPPNRIVKSAEARDSKASS